MYLYVAGISGRVRIQDWSGTLGRTAKNHFSGTDGAGAWFEDEKGLIILGHNCDLDLLEYLCGKLQNGN